MRDLRDGAQQRLVQTVVALKLVEQTFGADPEQDRSLVTEALDYAEQGTTALRESPKESSPRS